MTSPAVGTGIVAFIEAQFKRREAYARAVLNDSQVRLVAEVLADWLIAGVAKDRAILALHRPEAEPAPSAGALHCAEDGHPYPCQTVRLLAAIDADHPAYREDWKPVTT